MVSNIKLIQGDCMDVMKNYPDNYFDLAIVDPPYGIGASKMQLGKGKGTDSRTWNNKEWDNLAPTKKYFKELFRVSKNQIIWGGNYFIDHLYSTSCFLVWDKMQEFSGASFEMAWTSFKTPSKSYRLSRVQAYVGMNKIHPTQKPNDLYNWIYKNYSSKDQKILDTHLGSGSNAIAAHYFGVSEFVGIELDKDYYKDAFKRFKEQTRQLKMF